MNNLELTIQRAINREIAKLLRQGVTFTVSDVIDTVTEKERRLAELNKEYHPT